MHIAVAHCRDSLPLVAPRPPDAHYVRAGDRVLFFSDSEAALTESSLESGETYASVQRRPPLPPERSLFLVAQKGRLFQRSYPDVPVVLDQGRYLVVALNGELAAQMQSHPPCFSIRPLLGSITAYEVRRQSPPAATPDTSPAVAARVARLDMEKYKARLSHLASLPTRHSLSPHFGGAADWCQTVLEECGFAVEQPTFTMPGGSCRNIVARKTGDGPANRRIEIVTAHLDSVNQSGGPSSHAPGADDNASGSAGVLAIAQAFDDLNAADDLWLLLFGGEEQGLFGSQRFLASLSADTRSRISSVINMDMIGNVNATPESVLLEGAAVSSGVIDALAEAASRHASLQVQVSLNPFNSDHVPFIEAGLPAVLTIEGTDGANDLVHTAQDVADEIDYSLAKQILRMNVAFLAARLEE